MRKTIRQLREEQKLTQFQLAVLAQVGLSTVVDTERFRRVPRVDIAEKLAKALGVTTADIIWKKEDTEKQAGV